MLLLRGGVAVDRWERLRGGAFGFGLYKVRNAYASSSTTTSRAMRATCSGSARSPRAARLASSATQRASAASTPPGLTKRISYTAAARGIRAPTGPLVPRCVLPPDTHPVHPRLGQGRALGIPISGPHAVNLVNRWWQFHDTQVSSWVDAAFQALAIDEERSIRNSKHVGLSRVICALYGMAKVSLRARPQEALGGRPDFRIVKIAEAFGNFRLCPHRTARPAQPQSPGGRKNRFLQVHRRLPRRRVNHF